MLCGLKITGIFQSTLPARGATPAMLSARPRAAFQSTLPARGATLFALSSTLRCDNFNPRSPHGERRIAWNSKTARSYFNPRSPHGERLDPTKLERTSEKFQSTLPARGATPLFFQHLHRHRDFNPRSPHGERPNYVLTLVEACAFQSTLPARGATLAADVEGFANLISIHAPRTGSDVFADAHGRITAHFNPRSPHGERLSLRTLKDSPTLFQSTLPARGATYLLTRMVVSPLISIHAPRTGSDTACWATAPSRSNFNPRSPHGERPPHRRFQPP